MKHSLKRSLRLSTLWAAALAVCLAAAGAGAQTQLTILWMVDDLSNENDVAILQAFEEAHPGITVEYLFSAWDTIRDQTQVMIAAGQSPDVLWIREGDFYDFAVGGLLVDLGPYIDRDPGFDPGNFLPGVLESAQVGGVQYGLHRDVWAPTIFYNVDMFSNAGLAEPWEGWTYDDVLEAAIRISDPENNRFGMGNVEGFPAILFRAFGGDFLSADRSRFLIDEPPAVAAVEYMHSFPWVHHVQPRPGELADWFEPQFRRAEVAMMWWGPWAWQDFHENLPFVWDVAPVPAGPGGAVTTLDGLLLGISVGSRNPDEAWKLLRFLAYDERAQTMGVFFGFSPTVNYPRTLQAFFQAGVTPRTLENYLNAIQNAQPGYPRLPDRVAEVINQAIASVMADEVAARPAMEAAAQQASAILNQLEGRQ